MTAFRDRGDPSDLSIEQATAERDLRQYSDICSNKIACILASLWPLFRETMRAPLRETMYRPQAQLRVEMNYERRGKRRLLRLPMSSLGTAGYAIDGLRCPANCEV